MEEEPGDWVAHQAEVDTLINKIQVYSSPAPESKFEMPHFLLEISLFDANEFLWAIKASNQICLQIFCPDFCCL